MPTRREYPPIALRSLVAITSLAAALLAGHALTDAPAGVTQLRAAACPQDTHWSEADQSCVADTHWVVTR